MGGIKPDRDPFAALDGPAQDPFAGLDTPTGPRTWPSWPKVTPKKVEPPTTDDTLARLVRGQTAPAAPPPIDDGGFSGHGSGSSFDGPPSLLSRAAGSAWDLAKGIVTQPVHDAFDALVTPVQGEERSTGSRAGFTPPARRGVVTEENTPGSIDPERQIEAGMSSTVNAMIPGLQEVGALGAGRLTSLVERLLGKSAVPAVVDPAIEGAEAAARTPGAVERATGRALGNSPVGAYYDPEHPVRGAAVGALAGEVLHQGTQAVGAIPGTWDRIKQDAQRIAAERRSAIPDAEFEVVPDAPQPPPKPAGEVAPPQPPVPAPVAPVAPEVPPAPAMEPPVATMSGGTLLAPQVGTEVTQTVPGPGGIASTMHGVIILDGQGRTMVRTTHQEGMFGVQPMTGVQPMGPAWLPKNPVAPMVSAPGQGPGQMAPAPPATSPGQMAPAVPSTGPGQVAPPMGAPPVPTAQAPAAPVPTPTGEVVPSPPVGAPPVDPFAGLDGPGTYNPTDIPTENRPSAPEPVAPPALATSARETTNAPARAVTTVPRETVAPEPQVAPSGQVAPKNHTSPPAAEPLALKYLSFSSDKALAYHVRSADGAIDGHYSLYPSGRLTDASGKVVRDRAVAERVTSAIREDLPKQSLVSDDKLEQYGAQRRLPKTSEISASAPASTAPAGASKGVAAASEKAPAAPEQAAVKAPVHTEPAPAQDLPSLHEKIDKLTEAVAEVAKARTASDVAPHEEPVHASAPDTPGRAVREPVAGKPPAERPAPVRDVVREGAPAERSPGRPASRGAGVRGDAERPESVAGTGADELPRVGSVESESRVDGPGSDVADRAGAEASGPDGRDAGSAVIPLVRHRNVDLEPFGDLAQGGLKTRFRNNITAIRTLKAITAEGRRATPEEQAHLARYIGWGSLPHPFEPSVKPEWAKEKAELEAVLTPAELRAARASTLNAHYTSRAVVQGIWKAVQRLGFTGGRVLEPAVGTGNFLGYMPKDLRGSTRAVGVELDPITAGIAKALYPESRIHHTGFEKFRGGDGSFDLAIGNPPFGAIPMRATVKGMPDHLSIHDFFFAHAIHQVRPGGILAFITSRYSMDATSGGNGSRDYLAGLADLVGAIRLPGGAFQENAGTKVITDLIILRRKIEGEEWPLAQSFTGTSRVPIGGEHYNLNNYFVQHPDMVIGTMEQLEGKGMYRDKELGVTVPKDYDFDRDLARDIAERVARLPADLLKPPLSLTSADPISLDAEGHKHGSLVVDAKGNLLLAQDGKLEAGAFPKDHVPRLKALVALRDAVNTVIDRQMDGSTGPQIANALKLAQAQYAAFAKKFGPVNLTTRTETNRKRKDGSTVVLVKQPNLKYFRSDPEAHRVIAAEQYDEDTGIGKPAPLITEPTLVRQAPPEHYDSALDALPAVLNSRGKVDLPEIARLTGLTEAEALDQLGEKVFLTPEGGYETASRYLSGPVRAKLAQAERAAGTDSKFARNVAALRDAQPVDVAPRRITFSIGQTWIPNADYEAFLADLLASEGLRSQDRGNISVANSALVSGWSVAIPKWAENTVTSTVTYGTPRMPLPALMEVLLGQNTPSVYDTVRGADNKEKRVLNEEATAQARAKADALKQKFQDWVYADGDRLGRLAGIFNAVHNDTKRPVFDGSHLSISGVTTYRGRPFLLRPHQTNFAWRYFEQGNSYAAHVVGSGKTFTGAAIAVEGRRLGLVKKPMIVAPNHMLGQWEREFLAMYPNARLLVADAEEFAPDERKRFIAKAAAQDWDAIIIKQTAFEMIPLRAETEQRLIEGELDEMEHALVAVKQQAKPDKSIVKEVERQMQKIAKRLEALRKEERKDDGFSFDEMGVDLMIVDEAHMYKNLQIVSSIRGAGHPGNQRTFDMLLKTQVVNERNPGRGLVMLSGTPVSNSFSELYTLQRYLQPDVLKAKGLYNFDAWVANFAEPVSRMERKADGTYAEKTRFLRYKNLHGLWNMLGPAVDVQSQEMLGLPRPALQGGQANIVSAEASPELTRYVRDVLAKRALEIRKRGGKPEKGMDNMLSVTNDGRHAGLDIRLRVASAPDLPGSKVNQAVRKIAEIYRQVSAHKGTQLVFLDLSAPGSAEKAAARGGQALSIYEDMRDKLVAAGVPGKEIAFAQTADNDARKAVLHQEVREGKIRVLFGSTEVMGAGTNVQTRLVALHRLDVPWKPSDIEQSEGRILRQGNLLVKSDDVPHAPFDDVQIHRYVTRGSYDEQLWTIILGKAGMIHQFLSGGLDGVDETGEVELSAAQAVAAAAENPDIPRKLGLEQDVRRLKVLEHGHREEQLALRSRAKSLTEHAIPNAERAVSKLVSDQQLLEDTTGDKFAITIGGKKFSKRTEAGDPLKAAVATFLDALPADGSVQEARIGEFAGLQLRVRGQLYGARMPVEFVLEGTGRVQASISKEQEGKGLLATLEHMVKSFPGMVQNAYTDLSRAQTQLSQVQQKIGAPFVEAGTLASRKEELEAVNARLRTAQLSEGDRQIAGALAQEPPDAVEVPEQPTEEEPPSVTLSGFADPFSAGVAEVRRMAQAYRRRQAASRQPLVSSEIPEVEARIMAAKGLKPLGIIHKAREGLNALKALQRHFATLDPSTDAVHARLYLSLLRVEHGGKYAQAIAYDALARITEGLEANQVDLMTRQLVLDDLLKDMDAGLYEDHAPPFGYGERSERYDAVTARNQVEDDLAKVTTALGEHPEVREALNRRAAFVHGLTQRLVALDLLPGHVLNDPRYYHRQVLAYAQAKTGTPLQVGTREVRTKKKGFQRARAGGGDFNTAYQEAEYEWVAQALQQIGVREALNEVDHLANIQPVLAQAAKTQNKQAIMGTSGMVDYQRFTGRIAMHTDALYEGILDGSIPREASFGPMLDQLVDALEARVSRDNPGWEPFRFRHPDWYRFLNFLASKDGPGAMPAAGVFKAIRDREASLKQHLGRDYATWQDLVPTTHKVWQPVKGNLFHSALTVEEKTVQALLGGEAGLVPADVKAQLVLGARREEWVLPVQIADTMDRLGRTPEYGALQSAWRTVINGWKVWTLLNPVRAFKYNFNNATSDAEAAVLFPGIYKELAGAARDVTQYMLTRSADPAHVAEMQKLMRLRVLDGGITSREITDVTKLPAFKHLAEVSPFHFMNILALYWDKARLLSTARENVLRVAAYRHFLAAEAGGARLLGASKKEVIEKIRDPEERAAMLAADLLGDYGAMSGFTQVARESILPFFSWKEVAMRRYVNLFRNQKWEGGPSRSKILEAMGLRGVAMAAGIVARLAAVALLANVFLVAAQLWNHLFFPDEEKQLRQADRQRMPHLVLGRHADGSIRTVTVASGFADWLDWLNLGDWMADASDVVGGQKSITQQGLETIKAPVTNLVQSWEPFTKTAAEMLTGHSLFPDPFKPVPIRDTKLYLARQVSMGGLYQHVMGLPTPPGDGVLSLLTQTTDPAEAAYYEVRQLAMEFEKGLGKGSEGGQVFTDKANALYYYKQALKWGEPDLAEKWYARYLKEGGTRKKMHESVKRAEPLGALPLKDHAKFLHSLDPDQRAMVDLAKQWFRTSTLQPSRRLPGMTLPPAEVIQP